MNNADTRGESNFLIAFLSIHALMSMTLGITPYSMHSTTEKSFNGNVGKH